MHDKLRGQNSDYPPTQPCARDPRAKAKSKPVVSSIPPLGSPVCGTVGVERPHQRLNFSSRHQPRCCRAAAQSAAGKAVSVPTCRVHRQSPTEDARHHRIWLLNEPPRDRSRANAGARQGCRQPPAATNRHHCQCSRDQRQQQSVAWGSRQGNV